MTEPLPDPQCINADQLRRVGLALYGSGWKQVLSHQLGYHPRTVSRWSASKGAPPRHLAEHLLLLCDARRKELHVVAQELLAHKGQCLDSLEPEA